MSFEPNTLFEKRLNETVHLIEQRLESLCTDLTRQGVPVRLSDAISHALLAGGKRIRPFLVIETAAIFGVPNRNAIETAAAIECIHCYSLAHDDLPAMDNDRLRRGKTTVWAQFDDWTAILAGDALQAIAFELLSAETCHQDPQIRTTLIAHLARASGGAGMVGGQALDLQADKLGTPEKPDLSHIQNLQAMKTGALIGFSTRAGAILAGSNASDEDAQALTAYGDHLGYAFQIADDLLDAQGDELTTGKAVAKDQAAGKATLVSTLGIKQARAKLEDVHAKALAALDRFGPKADTLRHAADFVIKRNR